ncbi:MAG TPA: hypothetical protein VEL76_03920 [Gemmataceae bacterium]|nr:hypothetical protein [Gemmataceae bacterium]
MPESPPSRGRTTVQKSAASASESSRSTALPQIQVRYYKKMKAHRVYPVVVSWKQAGKGRAGSGNPVLLRLVMAGAQVVPSEQPLDPADGAARATFYVTPLAKGWLRGERLEVIQGGRKVQEIKLPAKVNSQRKTWLLFFLTFFIPFFVVPYFTDSPIREPMPGPQRDLEEIQWYPPGKSLAAKLERILPHVPAWLENAVPVAGTVLRAIPERICAFYDVIYFEVKNSKLPLGFYCFWIFLGLTVLSWWWHLDSRKRRLGKALVMED